MNKSCNSKGEAKANCKSAASVMAAKDKEQPASSKKSADKK